MVDHRQILRFASVEIVTPAYADDDDDQEQRQYKSRNDSSHAIKEVHEVVANLTLVCAVIHILFVLVYRRRFALCMIRGSSGNSKT